jgi:nucleoside-diphosphate kinase
LTAERTFVAIKPDGVERNLTGEIIKRFEKRGLKVVGLKLMVVTPPLAETHYGEHKGKPFYDGLIKHITSGPIVAMVLEGKNAIAAVSQTVGATNPVNAQPGTIRADLCTDMGRNVVHRSDSPESAKREIGIFFQPEELVSNWTKALDRWVFE